MIWALLLPGLFLYCIFQFWLSRRPVCPGGKLMRPMREILKAPQQIKYNLRDVAAPKVTGFAFKFLIRLAYTRFGRYFVIPSLMKKSHLDCMLGVYMPEKPTLYITPPTSCEDHTHTNQEIVKKLVERVMSEEERDQFHLPNVADYVKVFRSGEVTPTDVAEAVLKAIEHSNSTSPPLRAIVDTDRSVVLAMAAASTQRWKEGKTLSIIDGIPIAIKEEMHCSPYEFRAGATFVPIIAKGVPESVIVQKLKDAGGVIIGVANLQEFGTGTLGSNPNKLHLTARNPYDPHCYAGGSSSGSAVSVAAGLCPIAIGADGGGSIRIPATSCGVVGIKPTNSFIDKTGSLPTCYSVGAPGPLCSSVLDAAITLDIISRETDGTKKIVSLEGLGEDRLDGLNVGVYWEHFQHADKEIVQHCKAALSHLQSLGANIVEIKIPELENIRIAHFISIVSEFASSLGPDIDVHHEELNLETHLLVNTGFTFSAVEYLNAQKQRTRAIEALKYIFDEQKVDVIVTPGTACPAPNINPSAVAMGISDSKCSAELMRFSFLGNLTGVPGLVLPVGYTGAGLPVGLQVMGRWYHERTLLKVGWALEKTNAFPAKKPKVFYDLINSAKN